MSPYKRELRDDEHGAADVGDRAVHRLARVTLEHAHVTDLAGHVLDVRRAVVSLDADEHQEPATDLAHDALTDATRADVTRWTTAAI